MNTLRLLTTFFWPKNCANRRGRKLSLQIPYLPDRGSVRELPSSTAIPPLQPNLEQMPQGSTYNRLYPISSLFGLSLLQGKHLLPRESIPKAISAANASATGESGTVVNSPCSPHFP